MNGMELQEMEDPLSGVYLCQNYQQSGFIGGVKVGMILRQELD